VRRLICRLFGHRWGAWHGTGTWLTVRDCMRCCSYQYDTETGHVFPFPRDRSRDR
jgi:hypothetical protein